MLRKLSNSLLILSAFAGAGLSTWVAYRWGELSGSDTDIASALLANSSEDVRAAAVVLGAWVVGYLLSFDIRRERRPQFLVMTTAAAAAIPFGFVIREYMGAEQYLLSTRPEPDLYLAAAAAACALAMVLLVLTFEWINRILWDSLAKTFDEKDMAGPALVASRMSLAFRPGQPGMLRSVALARFRNGVRGDAVDVLLSLHREGKSDPDVLEALCKYANEQEDRAAYLGYLTELHAMLPEEKEIRDTLMETLVEQGKYREALELMEEHGVPEDEEWLERYAMVLLEEGMTDRATDVCRKLGEVEGIPFRRSQRLLREVLSRMSECVPALNILAGQANRMAQRDQRIRWLEKSLEADPSQSAVRDQLVEIYRALGQSVRLEELLRPLVEANPRDLALQFEFAEILHQNDSTDRALSLLERNNVEEDAPVGALVLEAQIRFERQDWEGARRVARKAVDRQPAEAESRQVELLLGRIEKAVLTEEVAAIVEEARANPEDIDLQLTALRKLIEGGHAEKVVGLVDEILGAHPEQRERITDYLREYVKKPQVPFVILNLLGDHLSGMGKFEETIEVMDLMAERSIDPVGTVREASQKVLRRSPHHLPTLRFLGEFYQKHGRFTDMIHSYALYLSHGGEETEPMVRALARAYLTLGDYPNAKRFVDRVLAIKEDEPDLLKQIIPLAIKAEQAEDAGEFLKKLEILDPRDRELKKIRERVNQALGQRRFAFLQREIESGKGGSQTLEQLGDLASEMERFDDAITYYQRASRDKENPVLARRCQAKQALAYMKKRFDDFAMETLQEIRIDHEKDKPEDLDLIMDILYQIGDMMMEFKLFDKAERIFKQICKIDAGYRDVLKKVESLRR